MCIRDRHNPTLLRYPFLSLRCGCLSICRIGLWSVLFCRGQRVPQALCLFQTVLSRYYTRKLYSSLSKISFISFSPFWVTTVLICTMSLDTVFPRTVFLLLCPSLIGLKPIPPAKRLFILLGPVSYTHLRAHET